jgi:hypothetical protein
MERADCEGRAARIEGWRQGRFFVNIEPAANPLLMRKAGNLSLSNMPTNW